MHLTGLVPDERSIGVSCACISLLLIYLGIWLFHIAHAMRRVSKKSYTVNRIANISINIQIRNKGCACLS